MNRCHITLPDGFQITADVAATEADRRRGLSSIAHLPQNRGMLFVFDHPGYYPFWMRGCLIPLDIIWLDPNHQVVEISLDTPTDPLVFPQFEQLYRYVSHGGYRLSQYVLEINAGQALRHGLLTLGIEVRFQYP